ncbi:MAG: ornithine cyclodeaminase family protein [Acidimicrobiia bacterium]
MVLTARDVAEVVARRGVERVLDELIERLRDALLTFDPYRVVSPVRAGFQYEEPEVGLLEWMPAMELGRVVAVKTVGYHPRNPTRKGLPSVMATTSLYDTATGQLVALVDATLLTALRTGAASAVATEVLAVDGPLHVGVIGCGAQAVTQLHAVSRVRSIERITVLDTDPAVAASFGRRVAFLDRPPEVVERDGDLRLLADVDVLCTCTSVDVGKGPVLRDGPHRPWLHVNAVGADFPGKQELPLAMLERALLCPDLPEQCRVEGESQWVAAESIGPDLATLVQQRARYEDHRGSLTVFDSTGWALEDLVVAELFTDLARELRVGRLVELQLTAADPHDPYALIAP